MLLLTATEQLTSPGRVRVRARLAVRIRPGQLAVAWQGKEVLQAFMPPATWLTLRPRWAASTAERTASGDGAVQAGTHVRAWEEAEILWPDPLRLSSRAAPGPTLPTVLGIVLRATPDGDNQSSHGANKGTNALKELTDSGGIHGLDLD